MRRPGQVLTRLQLIEHAWDFAYENRSNVVDVYVRYLREKIDRPFGTEHARDRARSRLPAASGVVSRLPIRLRLTLFFTAAMAVVLAGAAWLLYLQVGSDLGSGIDQSLRSRAQDVGALVARRRLAAFDLEPADRERRVVRGAALAAAAASSTRASSLHRDAAALGGRAAPRPRPCRSG